MPEYRRASTEGGTFFFTVVTYERRPILCLEKSLGIMRDVIASVVKRHPFAVNAWVVLPDHMHCLWTLPHGDKDFSVRWALIKREFTRGLRTALSGEAASGNGGRSQPVERTPPRGHGLAAAFLGALDQGREGPRGTHGLHSFQPGQAWAGEKSQGLAVQHVPQVCCPWAL